MNKNCKENLSKQKKLIEYKDMTLEEWGIKYPPNLSRIKVTPPPLSQKQNGMKNKNELKILFRSKIAKLGIENEN